MTSGSAGGTGHRENRSICILACKRLRHNSRVARQAQALVAHGYEVTVVSLENPIPAMRRSLNSVHFHEIELAPWPTRLIVAGAMLDAVIRKARNLLAWGRQPGYPTAPRDRMHDPRGGGLFAPLLRRLVLQHLKSARITQFTRRAARVLRASNFDVCCAHDSFALAAAHRLAQGCGAAVVYDAVEAPAERSGLAIAATEHTAAVHAGEREAHMIRAADSVLCVGASLARWTRAQYKIPMPTVVRNCSAFQEPINNSTLRRDLGLGDNVHLGIIVGSLYEGQGLENLARALAMVPPHIHLVAMGPFTQAGYEQHLHRVLREAGIGERFHVLPPKPQDEVISYAAGADFGVIALLQDRLNHRLALPNKFFEYVMARLPIASGPIPDVVAMLNEFRIGEVFRTDDIDDIAACLQRITGPERLEALRLRVDAATRELNWETESKIFLRAIDSARRASA